MDDTSTSSDPKLLLKAPHVAGILQLQRVILQAAEKPQMFPVARQMLSELANAIHEKYLVGLGMVLEHLPSWDPFPVEERPPLEPRLRFLGLAKDDVYFLLEKLVTESGGASEVNARLRRLLRPCVQEAMDRRLAFVQRTLSVSAWKSCVDSFEDGVVTVSRDSHVVYQNPEASRILATSRDGGQAASMIRKLVSEFVRGPLPAVPRWLPSVMAAGKDGKMVVLHPLVLPQASGLLGNESSPLMHIFILSPEKRFRERSHREPLNQLSLRESEVLEGLLAGQTLPAIAAALGVEESTVRTYRNRIYEKLSVKNRAELHRVCFGQY